MAQEPKKRTSKARGARRRTHYKLESVPTQACPRCHQMKLSHQVCPTCGTYKGMEVIETKTKSKK